MSFLRILRAANICRSLEWSKGKGVDFLFRAVELGGEAGEVLNVCKKLVREANGEVGSTATIQDLADELADVVICVDLLAMEKKIDLEAAVRRKFNLTSEKYGLYQRMDA